MLQIANQLSPFVSAQAPVIFTGSVRYNLAPFGGVDDATLWNALEQAHLKATIAASRQGLDMQLSSNCTLVPAAQLQLLALARALVRPSKVVVIEQDGAEGSVEAFVRSVVKKTLELSTVLVIAR